MEARSRGGDEARVFPLTPQRVTGRRATVHPIDHLAGELSRLREAGLFRDPEEPEAPGDGGLNVSCNDYLGYARDGVSRETILATLDPPGAGASRLIFGTHPAHRRLEALLAEWVGLQAALLFSSGYAANVGLLAAVAGRDDLIVSDVLNHASIIDGCRLSRAQVRVVGHLDLKATEAALAAGERAHRRWVVTETYFSMDGNSPDLKKLAELCARYEAGLILDEAHALGIFGPRGAGLAMDNGVAPAAIVGTLGKAVGTSGAFVAGTAALRAWLWNTARSFVYSTATPPLMAALTHANVTRAQADELRRERLASLSSRLRARLKDAGLVLPPDNHGPIVPVVLSSPEAALKAAQRLAQDGFRARAIRPPTVPPGTARLRLTVTASLSPEDVERLADSTIRACLAYTP
jgi:8-amino-7-oxononanoate synthase